MFQKLKNISLQPPLICSWI